MIYCNSLINKHLQQVLEPYQLQLSECAANESIPGSFWGDPEAGLIDNKLYVREDTPLHSALHESCHYICMDQQRRKALHTDASGDYLEESAVCYLQVLLGQQIPGVTQQQLFTDMDDWGYSFRLGSTRDWFERDAEDAIAWLQQFYLIDQQGQPTGRLRQ